jgi:hypothetical protein
MGLVRKSVLLTGVGSVYTLAVQHIHCERPMIYFIYCNVKLLLAMIV